MIRPSPEQERAVRRTGQDVCVVAGPGSGKTRVLIERFAWLVEDRRIAPGRILAVTFTEKAATEIKQRLVARFDQREDLREEIERAYVSTVHGFCARLLRENAVAAGLDPEFGVMEEAQASALLRAVTEEVLDRMLESDGPRFRQFLLAMGVSNNPNAPESDLPSALIEVYEAFRIAGADWTGLAAPPVSGVSEELGRLALTVSEDQPPRGLNENQAAAHEAARQWASEWLSLAAHPVTPRHFRLLREALSINLNSLKRGSATRAALARLKQQLKEEALGWLAGEYYADLRELVPRALERIDVLYRARKEAAGVADFADLEERAIRLLEERPHIREAVSRGFDHILMDELQDTNALQWRLLGLIRRPGRFFGVGDPNQSIYGFRHADPEVFARYRESVEAGGGEVDQLRENHRSRKDILDAVNAVVAGAHAGLEMHRLTAAHVYAAKSEPSIEVLAAQAASGEEALEVEARMVARRIREIEGRLAVGEPDHRRPARFADIAVLVRSLNGIGRIEAALDEFQVPYLVVGGRTFFELPEIRDLVQLLRSIDNPRDELALARVLRSPLVGVSDDTLLRLKRAGWLLIEGLERADLSLAPPEEVARMEAFRGLLSELRLRRDAVPPDRLLARAIDACGFESALEPAARANLEKFLAMLRSRYQAGARITGDLGLELEVMRQAESEAEAPPEDSSNAVRILTVHKAKGLEFPVVVLPLLHREPQHSSPNLTFSAAHGLGVRWRDPSGAQSIGDLAHQRTCADTDTREHGEENRLLYVAMTRAREHLLLCYSVAKREPGYWSGHIREALGVDPREPAPAVVLPRDGELPARRVWSASERVRNEFPPPVEALPAPEELLEPAAAVDQRDGSTSVTSVSVFAACPRRYYLARYLNWPAAEEEGAEEAAKADSPGERALARAPGPDARGQFRFDFEPEPAPLKGAELGTQVHALLAGEQVDNPHPEAIALAEVFRSSRLGRRARRASRREQEWDFLFYLDEVVLRGQVDLWFEEGGELVVVDYKTDRGEPNPGAYALQLQIYALALERALGRRPDRAALFYLRWGREVPVELSEGALEGVHQALGAMKAAQQSQHFPTREGRQCYSCGYFRGACPAGSFSAAARA